MELVVRIKKRKNMGLRTQCSEKKTKIIGLETSVLDKVN